MPESENPGDAPTVIPERVLRPARNGGSILTPWSPGESGNPLGRALEANRLTKALERRLDGRGGPDALVEWLLDIASNPEDRARMQAIREVWDRLEGPVTSKQEHSIRTDRSVITHQGPSNPPALPEALAQPEPPDDVSADPAEG